ncbi:hypothetical protein FJT64_019141 [Amphibalanus amphitrite]|uniref:Secreted protein n=1 Tax=Amphibalanus amphitrite TaxID=1232801 RepID=A0A6A4X0Y7_AMPAM|nr:hypothetical protein FJT64_019141 [Amphibalanus amphitrite]
MMRLVPAAPLCVLWCVTVTTFSTGAAAAAAAAVSAGPAAASLVTNDDGWRGSDADGEGNFLVSPDAPADFVVPAGFQVLDLTREAHRIPGQPA